MGGTFANGRRVAKEPVGSVFNPGREELLFRQSNMDRSPESAAVREMGESRRLGGIG